MHGSHLEHRRDLFLCTRMEVLKIQIGVSASWNFDVTLKMHSSHKVNSPNAMGLLCIIPEKKIICSLFYNKIFVLHFQVHRT